MKKPGNLLYPVIRELGMFAGPQKAFSFPEQFYWRSKMVSFLDDRKKLAYSQKDHDAEALFSFLGELILKNHQDLSAPLENFRQTVRPVIELTGAAVLKKKS